MNNVSDILDTKLTLRLSRRKISCLQSVMDIVKECCEDLQIQIPEVIFSESLAKDFQSFELRGKQYFIYDTCLIETLYIYIASALSGFQEKDIVRLYMKLFAEELLLSGKITYSMYFAGRYRQSSYSFENNTQISEECSEYISFQSYFLIAHELVHLSLRNGSTIPETFERYMVELIVLMAEDNEELPEEQRISEYSVYFFEHAEANKNDFRSKLPSSRQFQHLLEESYCDYRAMKLLVENYAGTGKALNSVFSALNCLIELEVIRNVVKAGILEKDIQAGQIEAGNVLFYSMLRTGIILNTERASNLDDIRLNDHLFKWSEPTDHLMKFLSQLPSGEAFAAIRDMKLPADKSTFVNGLMQMLRYSTIV